MRAYGPVNLSTLFFLIALNLALFVITLFRPETIYLLGLSPSLVTQQPWTIISNMFVHAGLSHILFNMISLFFLGGFLLRAVGERRFLAVYFIGDWQATCCSSFWLIRIQSESELQEPSMRWPEHWP